MRYLLCFFLVGCYTVPQGYYNESGEIETTRFETRYIREYEIGAPQNARIGDMMIGWGSFLASNNKPVNGYRKELSYSGIHQKTINILYQEFSISGSATYARDAYRQTVQYDLSQSDTIAFRDITMKVKRADTRSIEFILLDHPLETHPMK